MVIKPIDFHNVLDIRESYLEAASYSLSWQKKEEYGIFNSI